MPRIPSTLILRAYRNDPLLPMLLKECRTLDSARNELRWLREKAIALSETVPHTGHRGSHWRNRLQRMCAERAKGRPLQYILGDQPFGDLEILCRRGVLIPRGETESYTFHAAELILKQRKNWEHIIQSAGRPLRILDLCSGTGCISLLLHALLSPYFRDLKILGVDASPRAIALARRNLHHNIRKGLLQDRAEQQVSFELADMLSLSQSGVTSLTDVLEKHSAGDFTWDVLISNPPYISPSNFRDGTTDRSVRVYEPIEALVPPDIDTSELRGLGLENVQRADIFYPELLCLFFRLGVKLAVFECGDVAQSRRVIEMGKAVTRKFRPCESVNMRIWHEDLGYADKEEVAGARAVVLETLKLLP